MRYLELTQSSIHANLALDEALLLTAEQGGPEVLRIWEWPAPAVVLGAAGRLPQEVHESACAADQVPITRRSSGGGTVLLGSGCLLYTLVLNYKTAAALTDVRASYQWILGKLRQALAVGTSDEIHIKGISDLTLGERKFSGNAQQRKREHVLHHGSILYAFELTSIDRYLGAPERTPEYREGRSHLDFVTNLPLERGTIASRIRDAWDINRLLDVIPTSLAMELAENKYSDNEWLRRR